MNKRISRRDALKVAGTALLPILFPRQASAIDSLLQASRKKPNVLIILLDALSARHLSLHGYPRHTSPSLEKFAGRATVYHSHYSAGNFTTPGTASMLTGLLPWSHRAINIFGLVKRNRVPENLFRQIGNGYHKIAFTQNMLAELLLRQFGNDLDLHLPFTYSSLETTTSPLSRGTESDPVLSFYAYGDYLSTRRDNDGPLAGSPLLGLFDLLKQAGETRKMEDFPFGAPSNGYYTYTNKDTFSNVLQELERAELLENPFFGYFHLWTPHEPYNSRKEFVGKFKKDGYEPVSKPEHALTDMHRPEKGLLRLRQSYDEYIADVDADLGVFLDDLERKGILDTTYVIITSDHGQLFERGETGHNTALMYDSVIHIPLLISAPGQSQRKDVHAPTSNTDLLPTLVSLADQEPSLGAEGKLLPEFGGMEDWDRSVFSMVAKTNSAFAPIKIASVSMLKGTKKLIYYMGYGDFDKVSELYDLENDPDEMTDLASVDVPTASRMRDELLATLEEANRPFEGKRP